MRLTYNTMSDFMRESQRQLDFFGNQIKEYDAIISKNGEQQLNLQAQKTDVLLRMVEAIAPSFSVEELSKLGTLLHNALLKNLAVKRIEETKARTARIAAIEADPEYIKREHLIDERTGEYTRELAQISAVHEKNLEEFKPYLRYKAEFEDLINDKYGTDEYEHKGIFRFFNGEHLENWKVGDMLCEEFKTESFLELRDKYLQLQEQVNELQQAIEHYQIKILYIRDLVAEHKENSEMLPQLPIIYQKKLATELDNFLNSSSPDSIAALFRAYPAIDGLAKVQQGLNFQQQYLRDFKTKLDSEKEAVMVKQGKLLSERRRYEYNPSKYKDKIFDGDKFKKRFQRNDAAVESRFTKYRKTNDTIYGFNDYSTVPSVVNGIFWWEVITNNRIDGSFSPSVTDYYSSNAHRESTYEPEPVERDTDLDNSFSRDNS